MRKFLSLLLVKVAMTIVAAFTLSVANASERTVFSQFEKLPVAVVDASATFELIEDLGGKWKVSFDEPTVPGWVSEQFVSFSEKKEADEIVARVNVDGLNFRSGPSLDSTRISQVYRNHSSRVLERKDGFVKILGPASLQVLIDNEHVVDSEGRKVTPSENTWALGGDDEKKLQEKRLAQLSPEESAETLNNSQPVNVSNTHLIAPGDSISLLVFGEPDLSVENVRVPQNGVVSFPLVGPVSVVGKTTSEVEVHMQQLLSQGYVKNPKLSVSIFSYRPIFIRGEVQSVGAFPYNEGLTVAKAIALAGGLKSTARIDGISITRDDVVVATGLQADSLRSVASGDILNVEADEITKEAESAYVYLHGEVAHAGEYEFRPGLTVEKAVVLAGGFTLRASKKKIDITRYESLDENGKPTELKRVKLYTPVKPGDVIKVGASWF